MFKMLDDGMKINIAQLDDTYVQSKLLKLFKLMKLRHGKNGKDVLKFQKRIKGVQGSSGELHDFSFEKFVSFFAKKTLL